RPSAARRERTAAGSGREDRLCERYGWLVLLERYGAPGVRRTVTAPPLRAGDFANTAALLDAAARVHGERDAYVESGVGRISYAESVFRARALAAKLSARGIGKGDIVALILPSGIDYAVCFAAL